MSTHRLAAGHWEMGNLLTHFSTARASGLKRKPNMPLGRPAKYLLKREKEGQCRTPGPKIWSGPRGRDSWPPVSETSALLKCHHSGQGEFGHGLPQAIKPKGPALSALLKNVGRWQLWSRQRSYSQFLFIHWFFQLTLTEH